MTLDDLTSGVRYYVEEETAYNFTAAEITFYLNRAQEALPYLVADDALVDFTTIKTYSVSLANGYNQSAPTDYLRIKHVFLNDYRCQMKPITDVWALDPNNPAGEKPKATNPWCVIFNDSIRLYPLQTSAGTYEVWYYKRPTTLSATTQECDFPSELEHGLVLLASVYALKKDHEFTKAEALYKQLADELSAVSAKIVGEHGLQKAPVPQR